MVNGILFSIISGFFICLQAIFNTRIGEKIGLWQTSAFVHIIGFIFSFLAMIFFGGNGNIFKLGEVNKIYLFAAIFGPIIIFSSIKGISSLGATYAISILLITQLVAAAVIDSLGLFGATQIKFDLTKLIGLLVMITGIIIFKFKG